MATADIFNLSDTWNDSGTTFTSIKMNVTDTASASDSMLLDLQVGGVSQFRFGKGQFSGASGLTIGAASTAGGSGWPYLTFDTGWGDIEFASWGGALFIQGSAFASLIAAGNVAATPGHYFGITATNGVSRATVYADESNALDHRLGANAQSFRTYTTFTDVSNYERLAITGSGITVESAGTGTANIDLALTPAGTGVVKFGTHSAIGAETVTGYITIKDAGGTSRKVAVVS